MNNAEQARLDYIARRKKTEEDFINRAERILEKHEYRCLTDNHGVEVWRCAQPGTSCYAFDIMMTRFGIAVVGDIDNLTWTVGNSYGMPFLAGKDVTYYMHTKLNEVHKKREYSEKLFRQCLTNQLCKAICDLDDCAEDEELPPFILQGNHDELVGGSCFQALRDYIAERTCEDGDWAEWDCLLDEAAGIGFTEEAQLFMRDNEEKLNLGSEWYEYRIDEVSEGLLNELYLINAAAKKIMAIKEQEKANEGGTVDSPQVDHH